MGCWQWLQVISVAPRESPWLSGDSCNWKSFLGAVFFPLRRMGGRRLNFDRGLPTFSLKLKLKFKFIFKFVCICFVLYLFYCVLYQLTYLLGTFSYIFERSKYMGFLLCCDRFLCYIYIFKYKKRLLLFIFIFLSSLNSYSRNPK